MTLDPDTWDVEQPDQPGQSSVDLGTPDSISAELEELSRQLEDARKRYKQAHETIPELRRNLRLHWADAFIREMGKGPATARIIADKECRQHRYEVEIEEARRDVALKDIEVFTSRQTNAQSRAKILVGEMELAR